MVQAADGGFPDDYDVTDISPDGHYGVLLPSRSAAEALDDDKILNTLVNLKTHARLAVIRGAHYFPGQNHHGLTVAWATDSSWCTVTYEGRFGFESITLLGLHGAKWTQIDLGQHIQKALDAAINQQAHGKIGSYGSAHFRSGPGRQILIRATGLTNPKSMENQPTYYALFQGTFDLASGKWTRSETQKIDNVDPLEVAYMNELDEGLTFLSEEDRLEWFDKRLNDVYQGVRLVLPAERFAAVKKEQIAWLKEREALPSAAAKRELTATRIQELRRLVW